jgi:hypothetical protein
MHGDPSVLLFALMPEHPNSWVCVIPAMFVSTIGVDILLVVSGVLIMTNTSSHNQGFVRAVANNVFS